MTTYATYPSSLPGLGFDVQWTPEFLTNVQRSMSGKEVGISFWSYPIRNYVLTYDVLSAAPTSQDMQALLGFFNSALARGNVFLFTDPDDYTVTGQSISTAGGVSTYQMVRTLGGFTEPIYVVSSVGAVYVDTVSQASSLWSVGAYGSSAPGVLSFTSPPASTAVIASDFSYQFPCRFREDMMDFNKFMYQLWEAKTVSFYTQK